MRTLSSKYLGGLELAEDHYKVDLAVLDRYQSFSGELLRLSLLGIAGYGFLISNTAFKVMTYPNEYGLLKSPVTKIAFVIGAIALGISSATALGHRYFSTDCIAHYVRRLRLEKRLTEKDCSQAEIEKCQRVIESEQVSLESDLSKCARLLLISSITLVIGTICVAVGFVSTLLQVPSS